MSAVPVATPVTKPVPPPTVATDGLPLLHTPPVGDALNKDVYPVHIERLPVIGPVRPLTVTGNTAKQPVPTVYVILATPPDRPVTNPDAGTTLAMPGAPDVHVPPGVVLVSMVVAPTHIVDVPLITPIVPTVTVAVA